MAEEKTNSKIPEVPIWEKVTISVEEAAAYSNIGITKIYEMINSPLCPFVLHVSVRKRLIKRKAFEKYLENNVTL